MPNRLGLRPVRMRRGSAAGGIDVMAFETHAGAGELVEVRRS